MSLPIPRTIGVFANTDKPGSARLATELARWLSTRGIEVLLEEGLAARIDSPHTVCSRKDLFCRSNLVVVLGGDGTILRAAKEACSVRTHLLGVNLGGLGFLAEVAAQELFAAMTLVLSGTYTVASRLMVKAEVVSDDGETCEYVGLNDVVVEKALGARILTMDVEVVGQYVGTFIADGLIVATPTGSTAYSLSAGGPILEPRIDALIATPICAHSLAVRPVVFSSSEVLELRVTDGREGARLVIDGEVQDGFENVRLVRVTQAADRIGLVRVSERGFYDILRSKIGWGSRETETT